MTADKPKRKRKKQPDWENRYCKCGWLQAPGDPDSMIRQWENPECPLHSPDPKFDLPPEFP